MTTDSPKTIQFYRVGDDYGWMSNFAPYPIKINGLLWPTSEHYFQAQKFRGTEHEEAIRALQSPIDAAKYGRRRDIPLRPDWDRVKNWVMGQAVRTKFRQHEDIRGRLIQTCNATLVEHTTNDSYWGDGGDGSGENMLGRILMEVRERISAPADSSTWGTIAMSDDRCPLNYQDTFSRDELSTIKLGLIPEEMEDKWAVWWEDPWLHIHHSWTKHEIFRLRIEPLDEHAFGITDAYVNCDVSQYKEPDEWNRERLVRNIVRALMLEDRWI